MKPSTQSRLAVLAFTAAAASLACSLYSMKLAHEELREQLTAAAASSPFDGWAPPPAAHVDSPEDFGIAAGSKSSRGAEDSAASAPRPRAKVARAAPPKPTWREANDMHACLTSGWHTFFNFCTQAELDAGEKCFPQDPEFDRIRGTDKPMCMTATPLPYVDKLSDDNARRRQEENKRLFEQMWNDGKAIGYPKPGDQKVMDDPIVYPSPPPAPLPLMPEMRW